MDLLSLAEATSIPLCAGIRLFALSEFFLFLLLTNIPYSIWNYLEHLSQPGHTRWHSFTWCLFQSICMHSIQQYPTHLQQGHKRSAGAFPPLGPYLQSGQLQSRLVGDTCLCSSLSLDHGIIYLRLNTLESILFTLIIEYLGVVWPSFRIEWTSSFTRDIASS